MNTGDEVKVHPLGNTLLRTPETFERYNDKPAHDAKECFICKADGQVFGGWVLIENDFPYDAVAEKHMLLAPIRHFPLEGQMTREETADLFAVKRFLNGSKEYDAVMENLDRGRTFMPHYHLHVIRWKRV